MSQLPTVKTNLCNYLNLNLLYIRHLIVDERFKAKFARKKSTFFLLGAFTWFASLHKTSYSKAVAKEISISQKYIFLNLVSLSFCLSILVHNFSAQSLNIISSGIIVARIFDCCLRFSSRDQQNPDNCDQRSSYRCCFSGLIISLGAFYRSSIFEEEEQIAGLVETAHVKSYQLEWDKN